MSSEYYTPALTEQMAAYLISAISETQTIEGVKRLMKYPRTRLVEARKPIAFNVIAGLEQLAHDQAVCERCCAEAVLARGQKRILEIQEARKAALLAAPFARLVTDLIPDCVFES